MDDCPDRLAPEFNEAEGVITPFDEWWSRVRAEFPTVPEEVARYWLHEHWSHSPYSYLKSRSYHLEEWDANRLWDVLSYWCNFDPTNTACQEHGSELSKLTGRGSWAYPTATYMLTNGQFPTPIIVLDIRDGHMSVNEAELWKALPAGFVLIEGHRRFNLALHLQRTARLRPTVKIWVMKHA